MLRLIAVLEPRAIGGAREGGRWFTQGAGGWGRERSGEKRKVGLRPRDCNAESLLSQFQRRGCEESTTTSHRGTSSLGTSSQWRPRPTAAQRSSRPRGSVAMVSHGTSRLASSTRCSPFRLRHRRDLLKPRRHHSGTSLTRPSPLSLHALDSSTSTRPPAAPPQFTTNPPTPPPGPPNERSTADLGEREKSLPVQTSVPLNE